MKERVSGNMIQNNFAEPNLTHKDFIIKINKAHKEKLALINELGNSKSQIKRFKQAVSKTTNSSVSKVQFENYNKKIGK